MFDKSGGVRERERERERERGGHLAKRVSGRKLERCVFVHVCGSVCLASTERERKRERERERRY